MFGYLKFYCMGLFTASDRSAVNLERRLDHEGDPLAITAADAVVASGVPPWNWRDPPGNGNVTDLRHRIF